MASETKVKAVLIIGANGFIGNCVARAFVRAGWRTYGLVRNASTMSSLAASEILPIHGSPSDLSFLSSSQHNIENTIFDVIVSTTEPFTDVVSHFNDVVNMLRAIAGRSNKSGVRPLVLFSSGCKDYGRTGLHGDVGLAPHTEASPLDPPALVAKRTESSLKIFEPEQASLFDAVILRPTTVYGLAGSYYSFFFTMAEEASKAGRPLEVIGDPRTVLHGTHGDDVGDAYVLLASPEHRGKVKGQCYNISGSRYETLAEIAEALVKEYGITGGVRYVEDSERGRGVGMLTAYSQWVDSGKVRTDVGWVDRKMSFCEGLVQYRASYEVARAGGLSQKIPTVEQV